MTARMKLVLFFGGAITMAASTGYFLGGGAIKAERIAVSTGGIWERTITSVRPQRSAERTWRSRRHRLLFRLGTDPRCPLLLPISVRSDTAGNIFVLDWGERKVKEFSPSGTFVRAYGRGAGKGPGAFSNLTDFAIGEDRSVWTCDPVKGLVTIFDRKGDVIRTIRPGTPAHRIALVNRDQCVLMASPSGDRLFSVYDGNGRLLRQFGVFIRNQRQLGIVLDGHITSLGPDKIVYAAFRSGVMAVSRAGVDTADVCVETISHGGFPGVLSMKSRDAEYLRVDPAAPVVTRSVSALHDDVYLLAGTGGTQGNAVVDVYSAQTGVYRYSYTLPAEASFLSVTEDRAYAVVDLVVAVWAVETVIDTMATGQGERSVEHL